MIDTEAFFECLNLKHVELPDSLQIIKYGAFYGCKGLTGTLTIPPSVTAIGNNAFANCSGLTELTIPPSVKAIPSSAFNRCSSLKHVTFPDSLKNIEDGAFSGCQSLDQETVERLNAVNPDACSQLWNDSGFFISKRPTSTSGR